MSGMGYEDFFYTAQDGIRLHARIYGPRAESTPVICLAGLTRNAADFDELALYLSQRARKPRQIIAFDYRGRGLSDNDPTGKGYNPATEARDVLAGMAALGLERASFIGTSRGGLVIMTIGAMRPAAIAAVVLNDIGPVVDGAGLAQIRGYLDRAPVPANHAEAAAIQKATLGSTFPALSDADWDRAARAIWREDGGKLVSQFDPRLVEDLKKIDFSKPLPELWPLFAGLSNIPLMGIRGEHSKLLSAATFAEMQKRHTDMRAVDVEGQGHAPFLETVGLPGRIAAFLDAAS